MSAFGDEVKRLSDQEGVTQKELADACGVAQSFVSKLIRGEQAAPRADVLYKLCDALGVGCDHFRKFLSAAEEPAKKPPAKKGKK